MPRSGATQALSFVDVAWKIWNERADGVSRLGNAFSCAILRMLDIVSTSDSFGKEGRGARARRWRDGAKKRMAV